MTRANRRPHDPGFRIPELALGFPPSVGTRLSVLILGSFPGARSLAEGRYYANPHNRFWRAVSDATGVDATAAYGARIGGLHRAGIGLWDVLAGCERPGSLDQAIVPGTERPNDFGPVVAAHPELRMILLNGQSVAALFHRWVIPRDLWIDSGLEILVQPSTSPAHAAAPAAVVIDAWRHTLARCLVRWNRDQPMRHAGTTDR